MIEYLSITDFAKRVGLTLNTAKTYSQIPGRLPEPDAMIGRVKGWLPETVDAWSSTRKKHEQRSRQSRQLGADASTKPQD